MDTTEDQKSQKPEEATTVGMFLKYTRLEQKKDLDAISKALCIRKIYLNAIENDDYKELPPVPYGMGFVRSYAGFLGLNAERIVQCYKEEAMPRKETHKPVVKSHPVASRPNGRQILIGLVVLCVFYAFWLAFHTSYFEKEKGVPVTVVISGTDHESSEMNGSEDTAPIADQPESASTEDRAEQTPTEAVTEISSESELQKSEESSTDVQPTAETQETPQERIVVKFKGTSWFQISDKDKKTYVSGIFSKGYEYRVPNVPGLVFSVGKYRNVDVYIDGKIVRIANANKQTNIDLDQYLNH